MCSTRIRLWPVLFSLFINDLPASLPSSISCSLYADNMAIWSSSPSIPTVVEVTTQGALFRLERWSEYWCLPLNSSKCEVSFLMDPHQANLQPNLFLLGSCLCFNPTPTFLGSPSTSLFLFLNMYLCRRPSSSLNMYLCRRPSSSLNMYLCRRPSSSHISGPYAVSLLPHGALVRSPSLFCINLFFGPFSLTLYPDGFLS